MDGAITRRLRTPRAAFALLVGAVAVVLVLALVAIVLIRLGPEWLTHTEGLDPVHRDEARGRARTALFAMLAGVIALIGAIYTGRTFALNRRGQITERFTRAIAQLGDDKMEIRLGGIYALERIAHESSDEHGPILEILTAYVRENAPWPPRQRPSATGAGPAAQPGHESHIEGTARNDDMPPEASVDIKAILSVLARRDLRHEHDSPVRLDLARTNLRGAHAAGIDLRSANLAGVQLQGADLEGAQLQEANLAGAQLQGANLEGAKLRDANLIDAQLRDAILVDAQLWGTDLVDAQLQQAHLGAAQLELANLLGAQLQGANLGYAQLRGALLGGAQLQGANLKGAQLQGALLSGLQLEQANFEGARCDGATTWPDGFAWRDAGVQLEAE
jgi:uncharacterized protein YjbI with pentapeptide repeats